MLTVSVTEVCTQDKTSISFDVSLEEAIDAITCNDEGCIALLDRNRPVAILTERDIIRVIYENVDLSTPAIQEGTGPVLTIQDGRPLSNALSMMLSNNIRRVVVIAKDKTFIGILTQQKILSHIEEGMCSVPLTVGELLKEKRPLIAVPSDTSLLDILRIMLENNIGSIVTTDLKEKKIKIITEHDLIKLAHSYESLNEPMIHYASEPELFVYPEEKVEEVIALMVERQAQRAVVINAQGDAIGIVNNRDICANLQHSYHTFLETKLQHSQEVFDMLPDVVLEVSNYKSDDFDIHWGNRAAEELLGPHLSGKVVSEVLPKECWETLSSLIGTPPKTQVDIKIKDRFFRASINDLTLFNCDIYQIVLRDVTELHKKNIMLRNLVNEEVRKQMTQRQLLIHQSRLAEMGEMIGAIAHQWRQPLNALGLMVQELKDAYAYNELTAEYIDDITDKTMEQISYMSGTIDDFRHFFQPHTADTKINILKTIDQVTSLLNPQLASHLIEVKVDTCDEEDLPEIIGNVNEFKQVMLNLINNGRDSIIEAQRKTPFNGVIAIEIWQEEESSLHLSVTDNGIGIPDRLHPHLFEPYFTTKGNKGTGMGLYMCKLIIEDKMKGKVYLKPKEGKGACFVLRLPLTSPQEV